MKLLVKTTLMYLTITLLVFGLGGVMTYQFVTERVQGETKRYLKTELDRIYQNIEAGAPYESLVNDRLEIHKIEIAANQLESEPAFSDTLVWHDWHKSMQKTPKVKITKEIDGTFYRISFWDIIIESEDIYQSVFRSLSRTFLILVVLVTIANLIFSRWIFKPFQRTLSQIQGYKIGDPVPFERTYTKTKEFARLNNFIGQMLRKIRRDYQNLKEFTENASHEIQTPLAVAIGKMELLMAHENYGPEQASQIYDAYDQLGKLSRIVKGLTILTKIENGEYGKVERIDFASIIWRVRENLDDIIQLRELKQETFIEEGIFIQMDPYLAEMLVQNLLENAIKHNHDGGELSIYLSTNTFEVHNSGNAPGIPTDELFDRFKKGKHDGKSLGLGLAIVKKICTTSHFHVGYDFDEGKHSIIVHF
ncbi:MAG: HAMP domain-containing sensor histidine kinase [Bacteroidota bacterium]